MQLRHLHKHSSFDLFGTLEFDGLLDRPLGSPRLYISREANGARIAGSPVVSLISEDD